MANNTLSFGTSVSLQEAAQLIIHCDNSRFLLEGEPGIGKSAIMGMMEDHFGSDYAYAYIDCTCKDLGDIAMPSVDRERKLTEYFANAGFQLWTGKPVIIMLDEFGKAAQPVQNMLHPMLEARNQRLGDNPLPKGSRVFLTSNLGSDGVGDNIKAHTRNRVCSVRVRKPAAEEWLLWAVAAGIDGVIMAWVNQFPHCLDSYLEDASGSNPYIYNPKTVQRAYVSPRSLEAASDKVKNRHNLTNSALTAALIGTIGEAAARDMTAYIDYQDQLPAWEKIIAEPTKAAVPEAPGACAVLVFGSIAKITNTNIDPFMDYIGRLSEEWQACFCINIAKNKDKVAIALHSKKFKDWFCRNEDLL